MVRSPNVIQTIAVLAKRVALIILDLLDMLLGMMSGKNGRKAYSSGCLQYIRIIQDEMSMPFHQCTLSVLCCGMYVSAVIK